MPGSVHSPRTGKVAYRPFMDRSSIGRRLRQARADRGWSLREVGDRAGVRFGYIGEIEQGSRNPTLDVLEKLAQVYGLRAEVELLDQSEPATSASDAAALDEIRRLLPAAPDDLKAAVVVMLRSAVGARDRRVG